MRRSPLFPSRRPKDRRRCLYLVHERHDEDRGAVSDAWVGRSVVADYGNQVIGPVRTIRRAAERTRRRPTRWPRTARRAACRRQSRRRGASSARRRGHRRALPRDCSTSPIAVLARTPRTFYQREVRPLRQSVAIGQCADTSRATSRLDEGRGALTVSRRTVARRPIPRGLVPDCNDGSRGGTPRREASASVRFRECRCRVVRGRH